MWGSLITHQLLCTVLLVCAVEFVVAPREKRFSGQSTIDVELGEPRRVLWSHGRGLSVSKGGVRFGDASRLCIALKAAQGRSALDYVQSRGLPPAAR